MNKTITLINALIGLFLFAIIVILIVYIASARTNDDEAQRALSNQGYSNISITDRGAWFSNLHGCDGTDRNWYNATADNPVGKKVSMTVCCGGGMSFKGCTVRNK